MNHLKSLLVALSVTQFANPSLADTVKIGVTLPMTGVQAQTGADISTYLRASAQYINKRSLAGNHAIEIVLKDDEFDPKRSAANVVELKNAGAHIIASAVGTPNIAAIVQALTPTPLALWAPMSGPQFLYEEAVAATVVPFRAPYHEENLGIAKSMRVLAESLEGRPQPIRPESLKKKLAATEFAKLGDSIVRVKAPRYSEVLYIDRKNLF